MQQTSYPLMSISLSSFKFAMECDARLKHLHFAFKLEYSMPKRDSPENQRTRTKLISNFHDARSKSWKKIPLGKSTGLTSFLKNSWAAVVLWCTGNSSLNQNEMTLFSWV